MDGACVLIVDDEPDMHTLFDLMLRPLRVHVRHALSGRDALALVAASRPGLIVLDLMMPEMDGGEVLARLSRSADTATIPVIIHSANPALYRGAHRPWPAQVVDVIEKSTVTAAELRRRIRQVIESHTTA